MAGVAFYDLDNSQLAGAIIPETGGWVWNITADYSDGSGNKLSGIPVVVHTLDGDSLATINTKLAAGVKAAGVARGITVTQVAAHTIGITAV